MGEPIEIEQPGIDLADDVIEDGEPMIERHYAEVHPGTGTDQSVHGEGGTGAGGGPGTGVGRESLPSSRDAEREPPSMVKDIEDKTISSEDTQSYVDTLNELAEFMPGMAKGRWESTGNRSKYEMDLESDDADINMDRRAEGLVRMYDEMMFNIETYNLDDFGTGTQLQKLEELGERLEPLRANIEPQETMFEFPNNQLGEMWDIYEAAMPDHIRANEWAAQEYKYLVGEMAHETDVDMLLEPHYEGDARGILRPVHGSLNYAPHPEILSAIGDVWYEQALTEGTPENAEVRQWGGVEPEVYLETMKATMQEQSWLPTEYSGKEYAIANMMNAGWATQTASVGGQLMAESVERVFAGEDGPVAGERVVQDPQEPGLEYTQTLGNRQEAFMEPEAVTAILDDPDNQAIADKIVQDMYDKTQKWYADKGFGPDDVVPMYRGMGHTESEWNPTGEISDELNDADINMHAISSWTPHVGKTEHYVGERGVSAEAKEVGAVIKAMVPVKSILAVPWTGMPSSDEFENLVIGGGGLKGTIYKGNSELELLPHDVSPQESFYPTGDASEDMDYDPWAAGFKKIKDNRLLYEPMVARAATTKFTIPAEEMHYDWIQAKLDKANLTRDLLDGLTTVGPDGEEIEQEEIDKRRKKYHGRQQALRVRAERRKEEALRLPVEFTDQGGAIFKIPMAEPTPEAAEPAEAIEEVEEEIIERGGKGSGFFEHVGREGEHGGSAPEGTSGPVSNKPGVEAYGSAVFTPLMHDIVLGWSDQPGYQVAALIENNVRKAQERGDDDYHGLAIGQDGILMGIGALDYSAEFPEGYGDEMKPEDYLKIDGLYTTEAGFSEELMVQMAMEANRNGKGVWMEMGEEAGVLAAQMGMDVSDDGKYAHWTPEQTAEVAEKLQGLEQVDYVSPPTKPRITVAFDDAFEEEEARNPTPDDREPPMAVSEMPVDERYRWENFNYSRWATADRWDPQAFGKEQLGYEQTEEGEEEEFISNVHDSRVLEDLQNIHDGWIEGTHSSWSVRLSEAVANRFGGEAVPQAQTRGQFENPIDYLDSLGQEYGSDVVVGDIEMSEFRELPENEQWARLDEFSDFASGSRPQDIATDLHNTVGVIYDKTQAEFKAAGYEEGDTVRLYRGLRANPEERLGGHDGGWADVQQWAVSSWTAGKAIASGFATASGGEGAGGQGTLLTADIPIEKILANWQTGPGSHDELEYLVIGSEPIEAYATKVTESANIEVVNEDARMDADGVYEFGAEIE